MMTGSPKRTATDAALTRPTSTPSALVPPEPNVTDPVSELGSPPVIRWLEEHVDARVRERRLDIIRDGQRIPALLWTPAHNAEPTSLVLLGHGGSGSKREDYVVAMARRLVGAHGLAAAAIDGPVHGDRRSGPSGPPSLILAEFAQLWANEGDTMTDSMVADWRSVLEALQSLPEVGVGPVGWWGVSMGTIIGLPAVAADPRFEAAVLGLMGLTGPTRARIARDAPKVQCPVLFLVQWDDALFPPGVALELWEALGSRNKRLLAHPGGHGQLPTDAFEASAQFLARHLRAPRPDRTASGAARGAFEGHQRRIHDRGRVEIEMTE
jgi:dienelactone hydrolase